MTITGKSLCSNNEVKFETQAFFTATDKSLNKKDIEKLEKRWNDFFALERNVEYVNFFCGS